MATEDVFVHRRHAEGIPTGGAENCLSRLADYNPGAKVVINARNVNCWLFLPVLKEPGVPSPSSKYRIPYYITCRVS